MLEEALNSPTYPPGEAAIALLSFLFEEPDGSASEYRICRLFPLICSRVFGILEERPSNSGSFSYDLGGWLSRKGRWNFGSNDHQVAIHRHSSYDLDPVVQLLSARVKDIGSKRMRNSNDHRSMHDSMKKKIRSKQRTLIDSITTEPKGVRFAFPVRALTKNMQQFLFKQIEDAMLYAEASQIASSPSFFQKSLESNNNTSILCLLVLGLQGVDKPAQVTHEILHRFSLPPSPEKRAHSPMSLSRIPMGSTINIGTPPFHQHYYKNTTQSASNTSGVSVMLTMLEYYLISFAKLPLARQEIKYNHEKQQISHLSTNKHGLKNEQKTKSYGDNIYLHLFKTQYLDKFIPHANGHSSLDKNSEFFLRLIIEFWLDGENTIESTRAAWDRHSRSKSDGTRRSNFGVALPIPESASLADAYDLVILSNGTKSYEPNPNVVQHAVHSLVIHLITAKSLKECILDAITSIRNKKMNPLSPLSSWCLTPEMTIIQPSFYNFIRTSFKYADLHSSDSAFYKALNLWLIWLEPWNMIENVQGSASQRARAVVNQILPPSKSMGGARRLTYPRFNAPSEYSADLWEPYVAANLHVYIMPFAIFLKRAKEMDFVNHFHRSLVNLQRVLRVFSPQLVRSIHKLLLSSKLHKDGTSDSINETFLQTIKRNHEQNLGCFSPPLSTVNVTISTRYHLSQSLPDVKALCEEVFFQHRKKVKGLNFIDRYIAYFEGHFGSGIVTGYEENLKKLTNHFNDIMELKNSNELLPQLLIDDVQEQDDEGEGVLSYFFPFLFTQQPSQLRFDENSPERDSNGYITEKGRLQLAAGMTRCNVFEMATVLQKSDPFSDRIKSYEIPLLVHLTKEWSVWINQKMGLSNGVTICKARLIWPLSMLISNHEKLLFQINLRFLADYRNLIWICLLGSFSWTTFIFIITLS